MKHLAITYPILILSLSCISTFGLAQTGAEISLTPNFQPDPMIFGYISGGPINAEENYGSECKGYIASEPDHVLTLEADFSYLRIYVNSSSDTTMLIIPITGEPVMCNDDMASGNSNPQITSSFSTGVYHIYVGSFDEDGLANYNIYFSAKAP